MPKRTDISKILIIGSGLIVLVLAAVRAEAETCEIRPPVSAPKVCGRVSYDEGKPIENVELRLVGNDDEVVAKTQTDLAGEFTFDGVEKGDYHLVVMRSERWDGVRWPVKVTGSKNKVVCKHPIYVVLSPPNQVICDSWMTTKKPKFDNAQTH